MLYTLPLALWLYILHLKPSNALQQTHAYSVWWPVMLGTIPNIIGPSTNPKCSTKIPSNNVFCEALCPHLHCSLSLSQSWVPVLFSLEYMYSCCSTCDYAVADPGFEKGGSSLHLVTILGEGHAAPGTFGFQTFWDHFWCRFGVSSTVQEGGTNKWRQTPFAVMA